MRLVVVCGADIGVWRAAVARESCGDGAAWRAWWIWLYPLALLLGIGIFIRAWWWLTTGRIVTWRGTRYQIDRTGRIIPPQVVNA